MTIYYDFLKKPGPSKEEENPVLFPRTVSSGMGTTGSGTHKVYILKKEKE
ncbi:MAG: hypothetical protein LUG51_14195 [Tannerellaceae bacterium]|nr:hypothetical protein [Tannerellaceae bacterium]